MTVENTHASRLNLAGGQTGGIYNSHMGCLPNRSAINALMIDLTKP